jgi:hypothetical protein
VELFNNTLQSTFQFPWALIKASSWSYSDLDRFVSGDQKDTNDKDGKDGGAKDKEKKEKQEEDPFEDMSLPCFEDTKARIPLELSQRSNVEQLLQEMVNEIPIDNNSLDEAVEKVQALMITVFRAIRNLICDQLELFSDSFFHLPMSRHLEGAMMDVALSDNELAKFEGLRSIRESDVKVSSEMLEHVDWCIEAIKQFTRTHRR